MLPFLLVSTRPEDVVADEEYETMYRFSGLRPRDLHRIRLEQSEEASSELASVDLAGYSGVMVGGSPFNTSMPQEEKTPTQVRVELSLGKMLDRVMADRIPFLGACYGVGTLGIHQGGVVDDTYGEEVGAVEVAVTEEGARDPLLADLPGSFHAYVGHKEAMRRLPPDAVLLASGQQCPIQMFRVGTHAYATQFHPELDETALLSRIEAYKYHGYFLPEDAEAVKQRVKDGPAVEMPSRILSAFVSTFAR
ncbi:glutamine amidotransferase [Kocuria coralli]|uniref:Glutamine amidotransferase n=1 Tax=Kocuria coralli TaxID=1461025 RepID=A0A5J5KXR9_9MICC|nr:glutamine amidotransferase [Kocuria coralli]KAA9394218.1 glutamine amidotransferase [Kocuria coralli]